MAYQELIERLRGRHDCGMNAHGYALKLHYEAANAIEQLQAEPLFALLLSLERKRNEQTARA